MEAWYKDKRRKTIKYSYNFCKLFLVWEEGSLPVVLLTSDRRSLRRSPALKQINNEAGKTSN